MSVCGRIGTNTLTCGNDKGTKICTCGDKTGADCNCTADKNAKKVTCVTKANMLECSWDDKACESDSGCERDAAETIVCRKAAGANVQLNIVKKTDTNKACVAMTCKPKPVVTVTTTDASDSGEGSNDKEADPPAGACNESCRDLLATSYSHSLTQSDRLCLTHCLQLPADCTTRRTNERTTGHSCKKTFK